MGATGACSKPCLLKPLASIKLSTSVMPRTADFSSHPHGEGEGFFMLDTVFSGRHGDYPCGQPAD